MPKIAQYGGQQVETNVVQGARASSLPAAAFPLSQIAAVTGEIAQQVQVFGEKEAKIRAEESLVQFEREKNEMFFNPENGYFNTQGKAAYEGAKPMTEQLEQLKRKYADNIENEQARQLFDEVAVRHVMSANTDIMRHASKGQQAWEIGTAKAAVENTIENASLVWSDPERLNIQQELGRQHVIDAGTLQGKGAEEIAEDVQTYYSSSSVAAITAATAQGYKQGSEVLTRLENRLEGPDLLKMQSIVGAKKEAEAEQYKSSQAITIANQLVDQYGNDRGAILENLRDIKDPEMMKKARTEAMYQLGQLDQIEADQKLDAYSQLDEFIRNDGSLEDAKLRHYDKWNMLTPTQKKSIEKGEGEDQDWTTWYDLTLMSDTQLSKLDATQIANYASKLDKSHRDKFTSMVRSSRNESSKSEKTDHQLGRTRNAQTQSAVEQLLGKKKNKWSVNDKEEINSLYQMFDIELESRKQDLGRDLTSNEFTDMLNGFTRKTVIERPNWFDKEMSVTDIPVEERAILIDYLKSNGVKLSDEAIVKAYLQAMEEKE